MILVLGDRFDPHTKAVCSHLNRLGADHRIIDPLETVRLPASFHAEDGKFEQFSAIWDRQKPVAAPRSNRGQYIIRERIAAIRSLQLLHKKERLMNPPLATEAARSKLLQLSIAKRVGFDTPRTYIGNDPAKVRAFVRACEAGAVAKTLTWFFDGANRFTFTNRIQRIPPAAAIAYAPTIYQEYVPKKFELRVTMVGRKLFAAKILSQNNAKTLIDWRRDQFDLDYEEITLEPSLKRKLTRVLFALGLNFGAFDLIVTPEKKYVFLEVNSSGNWLWLESRLGLPISAAIAKWLESRKLQVV
jgi:glutathione synthase/RimK-type ligase-like ATP-grasp enzyme